MEESFSEVCQHGGAVALRKRRGLFCVCFFALAGLLLDGAHTRSRTRTQLIKHYKVSDLPLTKTGAVVTVSSNDSLEQGFQVRARDGVTRARVTHTDRVPACVSQKLCDSGILSAPVWNEETKKYTGFLDMRDLVSSVVFIAEHATNAKTKTLADLFVNAKWVGGAFTVTYLSRRNPFRSVHANDPLSVVLDLLAKKGPGRLKRLAVVDGDGKVVNIVSQTTLVSFLRCACRVVAVCMLTTSTRSKQIAEHHLYVGKTVEEMQLGSSPVTAIADSHPAIEAFKMMDSKQVTGLAIVDQHGKLVGNISARDLKIFIRFIDFDALLQPVGEFVKALRQHAIDIKSPTITVFGSTKFEMVVGKLAATKVHRIFVVNDETHFHATRVISLVDVLSAVAHGKK